MNKMVDFNIHPVRTGILIIDMTNAFLKPGVTLEVPAGRGLIPGLSRLIEKGRSAGIPIIFTTQAYRATGVDLGLNAVFRPATQDRKPTLEGSEEADFFEGLKPGEKDVVIVKRRFSAFIGTDLDLILRGSGIDTLIIGGVLTNVCCESTAREARMRDYQVIFLSDGTATRGLPDMGWGEVSEKDLQRVVLTQMAYQFAQVLTIEAVIGKISGQRPAQQLNY
ncbi:MAG: isochorismatase family cysteine hydrolase [Desulfobacterales bacterium]|nr:isochorismatase family cysteine hydrolase [Desulfobacterales bacterium]